MKEILLVILFLSPLLSNFASILVLKNGETENTQFLTLSKERISTTLDPDIKKSDLRAIIITKQPQKQNMIKDEVVVKNIMRNTKIMEETSDRILHKKNTFIYDQNKLLHQEFELIQYVNARSSKSFKYEIKFNSNYEKVKIATLFYSTEMGIFKPFPPKSIQLITRSKEHTQLKIMVIRLNHLKNDAILMIRIIKSQFQKAPNQKQILNYQLSEDIPVQKSELVLKISQKLKGIEVDTEISDQKFSLNYDIVKTTDYITRQWVASHIPAYRLSDMLSLKLTVNNLTRTKRILLYNKKIKTRVNTMAKSNYLKSFAKVKDTSQLLDKIKKLFLLTASDPSLKPKSSEYLTEMKTGTIEDLIPLALATLEHKGLRPELYFLKQSKNPNEEFKMGIKTEGKLYFLGNKIDRSLEWSGRCYYGYNLGKEIKIPALDQDHRIIRATLQVKPALKQKQGTLTLIFDNTLNIKTIESLNQTFPAFEIKTINKKTEVVLPNRTQLITKELLSFRIPSFQKIFEFINKKTELNVKVILPKNWRVYRLPDDGLKWGTYLPSPNGFVFKTIQSKDSQTYQPPILLKLITAEKSWFE